MSERIRFVREVGAGIARFWWYIWPVRLFYAEIHPRPTRFSYDDAMASGEKSLIGSQADVSRCGVTFSW